MPAVSNKQRKKSGPHYANKIAGTNYRQTTFSGTKLYITEAPTCTVSRDAILGIKWLYNLQARSLDPQELLERAIFLWCLGHKSP